MNVGMLVNSLSSQASGCVPGLRRTDIVLPDANQTGLTKGGEGASVEISLSPQAVLMMTIDMDSLAAKGYRQVNIDTDGKPGAEISIEIEPGKGTVPVGTESTLQELREMSQPDATDVLLSILLQDSDDKEHGGSVQKNLLAIAIRNYQELNRPAQPSEKSAISV